MIKSTQGKRKCVRFILLAAAVLLVMAAIFVLSQQPGESSQKLSQKVLNKMKDTGADVLTPTLTIIKDETPADGGKALKSFIVQGRKWAHVYLYALLGIFVSLAALELMRLRGWFAGNRRRFLYAGAASLLICFAYACSDEFHQKFIEGRTGCFKDVMFDGIGFGAGIVITLAVTAAVCALTGIRKGRKQN